MLIEEEVENGWSFKAVEERLIEAALLWRRSPGGGRWPFAGDGPWHLVKRELYGPDVDKDAPLRPMPLSRAEMAERDEASGWIMWIAERDRRLVALAIVEQAMTGRRVDWMRMRAKIGVALGAEGLRKRYSRAITGIAVELTRRAIGAVCATKAA